MRTFLKIFLGCLLAVAGIIVISARKSGKASPAQSSTYYYYPRVNMYYDVTRATYIYLDTDGKTWQSAKNVADRLNTGMGKKAVLNNPPLPVWKNNEHHRLVYSTSLYASANDFRKEPPKPVAVKKPAETKKVEEQKAGKKESGIERFFKRLFKKKSDTAAKDKKA